MRWMAIALVLLPAAGRGESQIERGQALFFDAAKGCGTCHAAKGRGTPIGPDLRTIARISVRAIVIAIRSSQTQYVQTVTLSTGESFPAMPGAKDEKAVQFWDLSKTPPELRKLDPAAIGSTKANEAWKHPPAGYAGQQLADIVAFVRYTFAGDKSEVDPADVQ